MSLLAFENVLDSSTEIFFKGMNKMGKINLIFKFIVQMSVLLGWQSSPKSIAIEASFCFFEPAPG